MDERRDFDLLAASLHADAHDIHQFIEVLAVKLEGALPGRVEVDRAARLLGGKVRAIKVHLGDREYALARDHQSLSATQRTVVHGVALKSDQLDLSAWIDALAAALVLEANQSEQARLALERTLLS